MKTIKPYIETTNGDVVFALVTLWALSAFLLTSVFLNKKKWVVVVAVVIHICVTVVTAQYIMKNLRQI